MNDRELAKRVLEVLRYFGPTDWKGDVLRAAAARIDALRWCDIHIDGPPDLRNGEYVLVVGYEDRIEEVSTPIRCWGGVCENRYWRYPEHPTRRKPHGEEGGGK